MLPKPKLQPHAKKARPCQTASSIYYLTPKNPEPNLQRETTESTSQPPQPPVFFLHVRKAEDRPVGAITPRLPEEVFV